MAVYTVNHPMILHKLSILRKKETPTIVFRQLVSEIGMLMAFEMTKHLEVENIEIETPVTEMNAYQIKGKKMCIVPILRAGLGMVEGVQTVMPDAKVGHIGIYRDEETLQAVEYFAKFPKEIEKREVILVDPMLATGATALVAINLLKKRGVTNIKFMTLVSCPEGINVINQTHPDVEIYTAAIDEKLNEFGYIYPGLGDAGDRIFGTLQ